MSATSIKILLTDYNDANRIISHKSLERSGYSVTPAKNGAHALGIASTSPFDYILLDIMMPIMDGMKALRELRRQDGPNQKTPAFALTAYFTPNDHQRYMLAGFDAVLSKPLRSGDLETSVSRFINKKPFPMRIFPKEPSLPQSALLNNAHITHLIEQSDYATLKLSHSRFWRLIKEHCIIIEKSLPNALRGCTENLTQFRHAVHSIKVASETIGLMRVVDVSRRLQNATPLKIPGLLSDFSDALLESRPALENVLIGARKLNVPMKMSRQDEAEATHNHQNHRASI